MGRHFHHAFTLVHLTSLSLPPFHALIYLLLLMANTLIMVIWKINEPAGVPAVQQHSLNKKKTTCL